MKILTIFLGNSDGHFDYFETNGFTYDGLAKLYPRYERIPVQHNRGPSYKSEELLKRSDFITRWIFGFRIL